VIGSQRGGEARRATRAAFMQGPSLPHLSGTDRQLSPPGRAPRNLRDSGRFAILGTDNRMTTAARRSMGERGCRARPEPSTISARTAFWRPTGVPTFCKPTPSARTLPRAPAADASPPSLRLARGLVQSARLPLSRAAATPCAACRSTLTVHTAPL